MNLPQKLGSFTLIRELSDDGIACSYLGILDEPAGKQVQIRQVFSEVTKDPQHLTSIRLRIGDLLHVNHPYLQPVHDFKLIKSSFYLVEEHVEGVSLSTLLKWLRASNIRLPTNLYLYFVVNLCTALEALHATAGRDSRTPHILHRAICPEGITIRPDGQVVLGAFGLVDSPPGLQHALGSSHELRHLEYLSPEQTQSDAALTPASDIFSLASVAYELLTTAPLFRESSQLKTIHAIRKAEVSRGLTEIKRLLPGLDKVLFRALALNPRHRYQRAFVLREDIRALMANFSFSDIKGDWETFISPMSNDEARVSTFPRAFGPAPSDSDDTSAILRASMISNDDTLDALDILGTDDTSTLGRAPTAETFAFLSPSSDEVAPPEAFQGFVSENTGATGSTSPKTITPVEHPEDVPMPAAVERTHPEIKRALESRSGTQTTWIETGTRGSSTDDTTAGVKALDETTARLPEVPKVKQTDKTGPIQKPPPSNKRTREILADQSITPKSLPSEGDITATTDNNKKANKAPQSTTEPSRPSRARAPNNRYWVTAGAVLSFAMVLLLGGVAIVLAILVFFGGFSRSSPPMASHSPATVSPPLQEDVAATPPTKPVEGVESAQTQAAPVDKVTSEDTTTAPKSSNSPPSTARTPPKEVPLKIKRASKSSTQESPSRSDDSLELNFLDEPVAAADLFDTQDDVSFDMNATSVRAQAGQLRTEERSALSQTPKESVEFSQAFTVLYADAKAREKLTEQRMYLEALMTLPENHRNPALLVERAQLAIQRGAYDAALKDANLADRHWARLPSKMLFSRRAMIYETQAASWQGKFYRSGGGDLMACHRAIQSWERYRTHVKSRRRPDLLNTADEQIRKLKDAKKRLEAP